MLRLHNMKSQRLAARKKRFPDAQDDSVDQEFSEFSAMAEKAQDAPHERKKTTSKQKEIAASALFLIDWDME